MSPDPVRRILVGIDGSPDGQRALAWAILLALAFEAEVTAVHAVGLVAHIDGGPTVPAQEHLDEIRAAFEDDWCRPLVESGVPCRGELIHGDPVDVIRLAARRFDIDLVVVGQRGLGRVQTLRLGSTSQALVERATVPVLVVPPPTDRASGS